MGAAPPLASQQVAGRKGSPQNWCSVRSMVSLFGPKGGGMFGERRLCWVGVVRMCEVYGSHLDNPGPESFKAQSRGEGSEHT